ncbi:MAG: heparan-alpha-glucosaminide N-acetyltransferase, partial [Pseudomonadota bacterium]
MIKATASKTPGVPLKSHRLAWVDALRGLAIVLMIIFHFCYDLRYFGYVNWNVPNGPNWWPFRYLILSLFIFTLGISLSLAHKKKFKPSAFVKRLLQLIVASLAITAMSLVVFPQAWIYFGILHFMTAASLVGIVFVKRPVIALALGLLILSGYWLGIVNSRWPFEWFSGFLPRRTEDFVPLFPWLGVMLLGVGLAGVLPIATFSLPKAEQFKALIYLGKHGLIIYLIHQPILFAGFLLVKLLT